MPGSGQTEGFERLAGVRRFSQGEWEALATQLGSNDFDPILDEADPVLHSGDDDALEPGEGGCTPVGSVCAAVAPRRRQTPNGNVK